MKPMGRRPVRFPGKTDHHPPKGQSNWWEVEISTESKKRERAKAKASLIGDEHGPDDNSFNVGDIDA